jgi:hypothetical protein
MVKMGKLVQKFENLFFRYEVPEKMVKQITCQVLLAQGQPGAANDWDVCGLH